MTEGASGPAPAESKKLVVLLLGVAAVSIVVYFAVPGVRPADAPKIILPAQGTPSVVPAAAPLKSLTDAFDGSLDGSRWATTTDGDFKERTVEAVDGRLRMKADTRETRDDTVKFLGVRSASPVGLGSETRVAVDIDWNEQANGSYLSAGLVLAPSKTDGNPLVTPDFLRIEYIGVPPGKNGRIVVVSRNGGREQYLFTEGWPEARREGRKIGLQKLEIVIRNGAVQVWENKELRYESKEKAIAFDAAHLYLQMSSHSNYPAREVFFDNVRVVAAP